MNYPIKDDSNLIKRTYKGFKLVFANGWWWCKQLDGYHFTTWNIAKNWIDINGYKYI